MKGIKLTPLLLFVLLLVVLVISVTFGKMGSMEGFVAFQKEKTPLDKYGYRNIQRMNRFTS